MKTFKIILVGDDKVGKSTFVQRLYDNSFKAYYTPTLGVNVVPIQISTTAGELCFNIWDCAGNETYKGLGNLYYSAADAAIIMFDLTNPNTFNSRFTKPHEITKMTGTIPIVYAGNKFEALPYEKANEVSRSIVFHNSHPCYMTSCKSMYNLYEPLLELAKQLLNVNTLQFISHQFKIIKTPKPAYQEIEYEIHDLPVPECKEYLYFCTKCKDSYKFDENHFCEKIVLKKKEKPGFFSFSWLKFW